MSRQHMPHWFWALAALLAFAMLCILLGGGTKREERNAKEAGGAISRALGLPSFVGEGIGGGLVYLIDHLAGKRHGHRAERKKAKAPA